MRFVIDSSVALAWCFVDKASAIASKALDMLQEGEVTVPALWPLELANILALSLRKGRIQKKDQDAYFDVIASLPIISDDQTALHALSETLQLAEKFHLAAYDAAYSELARRLDAALVSSDIALCRAASKIDIKLIAA